VQVFEVDYDGGVIATTDQHHDDIECGVTSSNDGGSTGNKQSHKRSRSAPVRHHHTLVRQYASNMCTCILQSIACCDTLVVDAE
jgi:hypothetical protein